MSWIEWYFAQAKQRATARERDLFFKEIKPGCSLKILGQLAKVVLDTENIYEVNWRFLRPSHLFLLKDKIDKRTLMGGMSNIMRFVNVGVMRRPPLYFSQQFGWGQKKKPKSEYEVVSEAQFKEMEDGAVLGLPDDFAVGVRALLRLVYYGGMKPGQANCLRMNEIIMVDGRVLIYKSGRLLELSDKMRLPLMEWLRIRARSRGKIQKPDAVVFRSEQKRVCSKFQRLEETYSSMRRLRG